MAKPGKITTKTETREKIAVWLENEQMSALRKIQERDGVSLAEQIRRAVYLWLEKKKK